ncbi:MAG: hypothetical protein DRQ10_08110 [Candidatus Hydrothermota bacterium]|nr:MAG: hypothetical protein DRQ10_08110 [Candidatus Hydrothermae bacterium]
MGDKVRMGGNSSNVGVESFISKAKFSHEVFITNKFTCRETWKRTADGQDVHPKFRKTSCLVYENKDGSGR